MLTKVKPRKKTAEAIDAKRPVKIESSVTEKQKTETPVKKEQMSEIPAEEPRVGVFICRCGGNISDAVDADSLCKFASQLGSVAYTEHNAFTCSSEGQGNIKKAIKEHKLSRVVIGCCTPKQYEDMYRETIAEAGLNPYLLEIVNLREQVSYPHWEEPEKALEKAKRMVAAGVEKAKLLVPLETKTVPINRDVAVFGAGIAGIHSALELAHKGLNVYLVEKEPFIGGNMARVVKTFPTDDCAMCTLSPKMNEVFKHPKIKLLTNSRLKSAKRVEEGLELTLLRKPRFIDAEKCTSCGDCTEACPVSLINELDAGLFSLRKAAYKPYPAAVPNVYYIDRRGIPPCRNACPISQSAQGYISLLSEGKFNEAFDVICRDNPLPSVCGRVCNHPCEKECTRAEIDEPVSICGLKRFVTERAHSTNYMPKPEKPRQRNWKIAVIGSGPSGLAAAYELAKLGYKATIFESQPVIGGMLASAIPKYRLPRDILQRDIDNIVRMGVEIKKNTAVGKDISFDELRKEYDAVFIGPGLSKSRSLKVPGIELKGIYLGIELLEEINLGKNPRLSGRTVVIGGGNVAVDVARCAVRIGSESVTMACLESREEMPAVPSEIEEAEREGIKIITRAASKQYTGENGRLRRVECLKVERIEFDQLGRIRPVLLENTEFTIDADNLIMAIGQYADFSWLPKGIQIDERGLIKVSKENLSTTLKGVFAGGDAVSGPASVVEAIACGKRAAASIHLYLSGEKLAEPMPGLKPVDKKDVLKEWERFVEKKARVEMPEREAGVKVNDFSEVELGLTEAGAVEEAKRCINCGGCSDCRQCVAACEPNAVRHDMVPEEIKVTVGAAVIATGFKDYDATGQYGYGKYKDVITQLQLARMLDPIGPTNGKIVRLSDHKPAKRIVMIQCVGSRGISPNPNMMTHPYCSRFCCMTALKHASLIKKLKHKDAQIYICNIDIRAFGKGYEEYYDRARKQGIRFIRGIPEEVIRDEKRDAFIVRVEDSNTNKLLELEADLVVLSVGAEPSDIDELIKNLNVSRDESGFIKEFHMKIRPTDTLIKNVFVCGCAQSPKDITDSIAQAGSAASSAYRLLYLGKVSLNPMIASVDKDVCGACSTCVRVCPYEAIEIVEEEGKKHAKIREVLCEGCGVCCAACPNSAISMNNFTDKQIVKQIKAVVGD